jgi:hypothetical protein
LYFSPLCPRSSQRLTSLLLPCRQRKYSMIKSIDPDHQVHQLHNPSPRLWQFGPSIVTSQHLAIRLLPWTSRLHCKTLITCLFLTYQRPTYELHQHYFLNTLPNQVLRQPILKQSPETCRPAYPMHSSTHCRYNNQQAGGRTGNLHPDGLYFVLVQL